MSYKADVSSVSPSSEIKNENGCFFCRYADKNSGRSLADFKINIVELSKYSPIYTPLYWIM